MKKEIRYENHEKVKLLEDYEQLLFKIREYLSSRAIIALGNTYTEKELEEEKDLMLNTLEEFKGLVNKHNCDLNKEFCNGALKAIENTKSKLAESQDTALSLINHALALTVQLDYLMLDFRDKFYDNLK